MVGTYAGIELDLVALTQTLDGLRAALAKPVLVGAPAAGLEYDRSAVLRSLEVVADAATREDP